MMTERHNLCLPCCINILVERFKELDTKCVFSMDALMVILFLVIVVRCA